MSLLNKKQQDEDPENVSTHSTPHSTSHSHTARISTKDFKIDLPKFDGTEVDDWIFCLEEYFDVANTPVEHRIKVASFHMIGPAYAWYKWMVRNNYTQDWTVFVDALQKRFGTDLYTNPQEVLKELKQQGTVTEYQS
uniref:Retrotransposon gag domain-containing protein n=1 Tax=Cajanus cajan TaxID=3821 RepID=A0A151QPB4_CAJCA|nr:hypothetical protein KK1_047233 [Cajanus cajan]